MAVSKVDQRWPFLSPTDLSKKQFTLVEITEEVTIEPAVSGSKPYILMDTPKAGEYGTVCLDGIEKVVVGTAVKAGQLVASDNTGKLKPAASGQYILGTALEAGEAGTLVPVLNHPGSGAKA